MKRLFFAMVLFLSPIPATACGDWLLDTYVRCGTERQSLRRAAMCEHNWNWIGHGRKGCPKCHSIADFVGGEWQVVYCDGIWVGPDPLAYPETYNLGPGRK